jgi:hypothetical protein
MGNYGEASKIATNLIIGGKASSPLEAWEKERTLRCQVYTIDRLIGL